MISFTKIKWAGEECILITDSISPREPILILDKEDIKELNKEWSKEKVIGNE